MSNDAMYEAFENVATDLIERFGKQVNLIRQVTQIEGYNTLDPETGKLLTIGSPQTFTVKMVRISFSKKWIESHPVEQGDIAMLISADGIEPKQNDVIDGYTILFIESIKPSNIAVLYKAQLRKG